MKVDSYAVKQQAVSQYARLEIQNTSIKIETRDLAAGESFSDVLDLSMEGKELSLSNSNEIDDEDIFKLSEEDKAKIRLIEALISRLTGKRFRFTGFRVDGKDYEFDSEFDQKVMNLKKDQRLKGKSNRPKIVDKPTRILRGFRASITYSSEVYEKEQMSYSSKGIVKTEDGKEIEFDLNVNMSREKYEKNAMNIQVGNFHDPLIIDLDGKGVGFTNKKISIDINLDGEKDSVFVPKGGSGFLALDKNNNGIIDDGKELFGPQTGEGFMELSKYDQDQNGWIDENDEIFNSLKIWEIDENGESTLIGLKEADVGAIYVSGVNTSYTLQSEGEEAGKIKNSSFYLSESGVARQIHEVDLKI